MSTIALIDTRLKLPGESIGTIVSTHETIQAAFKANEAFQKRMRKSGVKDHVPDENRHSQSTTWRRRACQSRGALVSGKGEIGVDGILSTGLAAVRAE
jgi:hypothetical protein